MSAAPRCGGMTRSASSALIMTFLLLPSGSLAGPLEKTRKLMRRERWKSSRPFHIGSEAKYARRSSSLSERGRGQDDEASGPSNKQIEKNCQGCESYDYVLGSVGENRCKNEHNETLVNDPIMCRFAAEKVGAHCQSNEMGFKIEDSELWPRYPKGCFHIRCKPGTVYNDTDVDETDCFYFSEADEGLGEGPNDTLVYFAGTPICYRPKFQDGLEDTNVDCPDDYQPITNEDNCTDACHQRDYIQHEFFQVGVHNSSKHMDYPSGCFWMEFNRTGASNVVHTVKEVLFNGPSRYDGINVKGTPICEVASPLNFVTNNTFIDSGSIKYLLRPGEPDRSMNATRAVYRRRNRRRGAQSTWVPEHSATPASGTGQGSGSGEGWFDWSSLPIPQFIKDLFGMNDTSNGTNGTNATWDSHPEDLESHTESLAQNRWRASFSSHQSSDSTGNIASSLIINPESAFTGTGP